MTTIGDTKLFFSGVGNPNTFTWSSRSTSAPIMMLQDVKMGEYIDAMLINQAQCVYDSDNYSSQPWHRTIEVTGTRTSASDEAVNTLKNYGIIVKVNGVTL